MNVNKSELKALPTAYAASRVELEEPPRFLRYAKNERANANALAGELGAI